MLTMLAAFAELERSNIKARQVAGIDARDQRNRPFFSYPLGGLLFAWRLALAGFHFSNRDHRRE